jgi:uncharacterized protein YtpQ (UPF0354 family)
MSYYLKVKASSLSNIQIPMPHQIGGVPDGESAIDDVMYYSETEKATLKGGIPVQKDQKRRYTVLFSNDFKTVYSFRSSTLFVHEEYTSGPKALITLAELAKQGLSREDIDLALGLYLKQQGIAR